MFECNTVPQLDLNFITQKSITVSPATAYKLSFKARGRGPVRTYLYGNTASGTYIDNVQMLNLSSGWQEYEQTITADSIPVDPVFIFQAGGICSGEITELTLTAI